MATLFPYLTSRTVRRYGHAPIAAGTGFRFAVAALAAVVISSWMLLISRSLATGMGQDFTTMYVGALALLGGHDPYSTTAPAAIAARLHVMQQGVVNSPLVLLLDMPLTRLAPKAAFLASIAGQYALVAAGGWFLTATYSRSARMLVVLALLASPAAFMVAYYGQIGAIVFAAAAVGIWARQRRRWWLLGICVACAFIKPQLGVCVAAPLLWGVPRRAWISALATGALLVLAMVLELGTDGVGAYVHALRVFDAAPFARHNVDALGVTSLYRGWLAPSWWAVAAAATTILCASGILLVLKRYGTRPPEPALAMLSFIAVLALPYSHQYDSLAVLPALFLAQRARPAGPALRCLYDAGAAIMALTPLMALSSAQYTVRLFPLGALACLLSLYLGDRSAATGQVEAAAQRGLEPVANR